MCCRVAHWSPWLAHPFALLRCAHASPTSAAATVAHGKAHMKAWLQERLGLAVDPDVPLIGFVGRLTMQKGVDVLLGAAPALLAGASLAPAPSRWRPRVPDASQPDGQTQQAEQPGTAPAAEAAGAAEAASQASPRRRGAALGASSSLPAAPRAPSPAVSNAACSSQLAVPGEAAAGPAAAAAAAAQPEVQLVLLGTGEVRWVWK